MNKTDRNLSEEREKNDALVVHKDRNQNLTLNKINIPDNKIEEKVFFSKDNLKRLLKNELRCLNFTKMKLRK
jgi:hypothetical protein